MKTRTSKNSELSKLRDSRELLWNLTLRELRTKYRRSFLGWTWSLLNPLSLVVTYGFVFGVVFGAVAPVGRHSGLQSYALYLLCGLLPWSFFNLVTSLGMTCLIANGGLIKKVAFSRPTMVLSQAIFALVQFSIEVGVLLVVMLIFNGPHPLLYVPFVVGMMFCLAGFATGIALVLSVVAVYFRDLMHLWSIVLQIYFFGTPIIYTLDTMKSKYSHHVTDVLEWHPMSVFVRSFRSVLYDGSAPPLSHIVYMVLSSVISIILGWLVFERLSRRIAEEI